MKSKICNESPQSNIIMPQLCHKSISTIISGSHINDYKMVASKRKQEATVSKVNEAVLIRKAEQTAKLQSPDSGDHKKKSDRLRKELFIKVR